jgi:hypothetical protein
VTRSWEISYKTCDWVKDENLNRCTGSGDGEKKVMEKELKR